MYCMSLNSITKKIDYFYLSRSIIYYDGHVLFLAKKFGSDDDFLFSRIDQFNIIYTVQQYKTKSEKKVLSNFFNGEIDLLKTFKLCNRFFLLKEKNGLDILLKSSFKFLLKKGLCPTYGFFYRGEL